MTVDIERKTLDMLLFVAMIFKAILNELKCHHQLFDISNEAKMFVEEQFSGNMQYVINKTTKEMQDYFKKNGLHSEYVQYQSISQVTVAKISNMEYLAIVTVYVRYLIYKKLMVIYIALKRIKYINWI